MGSSVLSTICESISKIPQNNRYIFITDRDRCVAASNSIKKEYYNNPISSYLEKVLADRKKVSSPVKEVELSRNHMETISYTLNPIIVNGDVIGLVGLTSPTNITDSDEKIASFITEFLCKTVLFILFWFRTAENRFSPTT